MVVATSDSNVLRTVCAHDCPDACSVLVTVEAGRVVRTVGDPQHPIHARISLRQGEPLRRARAFA